jgi:hypothetical protein
LPIQKNKNKFTISRYRNRSYSAANIEEPSAYIPGITFLAGKSLASVNDTKMDIRNQSHQNIPSNKIL